MLPPPLHPSYFPTDLRETSLPSERPPLKRQATAPLPSAYLLVEKKKRDAELFPADDRTLWSDQVHSAFLEALQKHPPVPTWRFNDSCKDMADDEQADYCRIIQEYILQKTGRPHSFEQISEHIILALSSPLAAPTVKTFSSSDLPVTAEAKKDGSKELRVARASTDPVQSSNSLNIHPLETTARASESASMSRRRKACNRPVLNLQVDIPPVAGHFESVAEKGNNRESASSSLTPYTNIFFPFAEPNDHRHGLDPTTPLDQCHNIPLVPPEIPRIHRKKIGRWIPTPTEGVLPSSSYTSVPSSLSSSSLETSGDSSSNDSEATQRSPARPKITKRTLSWLSAPNCATPAYSSTSVLASPIAAFTGPNEDSTVHLL